MSVFSVWQVLFSFETCNGEIDEGIGQIAYLDRDEDGFGDNYGNLSWIDRNENWPGEYYQYARDQDACPTLPGNSWQDDILGCPDSRSLGRSRCRSIDIDSYVEV